MKGLYVEPQTPNNCSHFFMAVNIEAFTDRTLFGTVVAAMASNVRHSSRATGTDVLFTPGEPEWTTRAARPANCVLLDATVLDELEKLEMALR